MKCHKPRLQLVGRAALCAWGFLAICFGEVPFAFGADDTLPLTMPDFQSAIHAHGARLAAVGSDKEAIDLFTAFIGPALRLDDVARTLTAKSITPKLSQDLLIPEITQVVQKLIGDLAAWQLAAIVQQAVKDERLPGMTDKLSESSIRREWLALQGRTTWLQSMNEVAQTLATIESPPPVQEGPRQVKLVTLSQQAGRLEVEALQAAYQDWDRLRGWKDRVRMLRGQARLCGTWQWVIHNHQQHHQERKLSLLFPPPGADRATLPGLVETIVLGDNVYLRWEIDGQVQEDSLQFVKEGQRLEGTFVNSQGGWGSISGKRTASCTP
jgi:hypothetical protein